jgi:hypothetical protein
MTRLVTGAFFRPGHFDGWIKGPPKKASVTNFVCMQSSVILITKSAQRERAAIALDEAGAMD